MTSIPVINFSSDCSDAVVAQDLVHAMETIGFVYLDNVPGYDKEQEQRLLDETKWFFSLPLEEKLLVSPSKWNKQSKSVYRGYVPISVENNYLREHYLIADHVPDDDPDKQGNPLYEDSPWPEGARGERFHKIMMSHYTAMHNAAMRFVRLLAIGLGLDEDHFACKFTPKCTSNLKILHYPTFNNWETGKQRLTCGEHADSSFVTLLATWSYKGLEVLKPDGVTWAAVEPRPGSLVVNIGDLLSRLTGRKLKATRHRVQDIGVDRFSAPFFFKARSDCEFEFPPDSKVVKYGSWSMEYLSSIGKYEFGSLAQYAAQN